MSCTSLSRFASYDISPNSILLRLPNFLRFDRFCSFQDLSRCKRFYPSFHVQRTKLGFHRFFHQFKSWMKCTIYQESNLLSILAMTSFFFFFLIRNLIFKQVKHTFSPKYSNLYLQLCFLPFLNFNRNYYIEFQFWVFRNEKCGELNNTDLQSFRTFARSSCVGFQK